LFSLVFVTQVWGETLTLKLATYNVRHCEGLDGELNCLRTGRVMRGFAADVIAVQELDSVCTRSDNVYQLNLLARYTSMKATFAGAIDFQDGRYGVGILSKSEPLSVKRIPLPGSEARVLLVCEFEHYVYACTHLDLSAQNRMKSLDIILQEARLWQKPFIIAGDWNDEPTSSFIQTLNKSFTILNNTDDCTYPAKAPTKCIDYIAYYTDSGQVRSTSSEVIDDHITSDHRPVVVTVEMEYTPDGIGSLSEDIVPAGYYTLQGIKAERPVRGLNIECGKDGRKRKVFVGR